MLQLDASHKIIQKVIKKRPHIERMKMATQSRITDNDKVNRLNCAKIYMS